MGVNILEDARHSSVFYVCKCFVVGRVGTVGTEAANLFSKYSQRGKINEGIFGIWTLDSGFFYLVGDCIVQLEEGEVFPAKDSPHPPPLLLSIGAWTLFH